MKNVLNINKMKRINKYFESKANRCEGPHMMEWRSREELMRLCPLKRRESERVRESVKKNL